MNRKSFWTGFFTGIILTGLIVFLFLISIVVQPDVSLTKMKVQDLSGNPVNIGEMAGKPVVINYWATWCAPCRQEFPGFENVKKRYEDKINFLMISDEEASLIQRFRDNNPYTFNYLRAVDGFEEISTRPTTFVYSSTGKLIEKRTGGLSETELSELLRNAQ